MKGEYGPELGILYLTFIILFMGAGGYWIIHSSTFLEFNFMYGPATDFSGKIVNIMPCNDSKRGLYTLDTGHSMAVVYAGFNLDLQEGDELSITAYNVSKKGILYEWMLAKCEPKGEHYYAIRGYSERLLKEKYATAGER
jgi:hypothetical protein